MQKAGGKRDRVEGTLNPGAVRAQKGDHEARGFRARGAPIAAVFFESQHQIEEVDHSRPFVLDQSRERTVKRAARDFCREHTHLGLHRVVGGVDLVEVGGVQLCRRNLLELAADRRHGCHEVMIVAHHLELTEHAPGGAERALSIETAAQLGVPAAEVRSPNRGFL